MGGACSVYWGGGGGEVHTGFWWGNLSERSCLENIGIYGSAILQGGVKKIRREGVEWVDLAQDRYKWQNLVNVAIGLNEYNLLTDREIGKFLITTLYHVHGPLSTTIYNPTG
jgi:hypothetical protein